MMIVLMTISGTVGRLYISFTSSSWRAVCFFWLPLSHGETVTAESGIALGTAVVDILRITVRTLAIKLIDFAFTLVLSCVAPNPGSACVRPHPTIRIALVRTFSNSMPGGREARVLGWGREERTASEEAVLGENGDGVNDQDGHWSRCQLRRSN